MKRSILPILLAATVMILLGVAAVSIRAAGETPFSEANVFFELNDTDGDLGIHALIDGRPWKNLEIEDSRERPMLTIVTAERLRKQGLTELFFESAEPTFDELPPEQFFRRFPEGDYEIEGRMLNGGKLESEDEVNHLMPAPPENVELSGIEAAEDCDADPLPEVAEPVVITWDPVTESHPEIGRTGEPIEVENYQVVIEGEDLTLTVDLGPDATEFEVPEGLTEPGQELKFEIVVREASGGNQTAVESCFIVE